MGSQEHDDSGWKGPQEFSSAALLQLLKAGVPLSSNEVAQGFIQLGLENCQGWSLHSLSVEPVPLPACPHG